MRLHPRNPMNRALRLLLIFEAVVFGLAVPGMIQVSGVAPATAAGVGVAGVLLCLVAAGTLPRPAGWVAGWLTQLVGVGFGFATDMMFWVGGIFLILWVITFVLGRRIEPATVAGP